MKCSINKQRDKQHNPTHVHLDIKDCCDTLKSLKGDYMQAPSIGLGFCKWTDANHMLKKIVGALTALFTGTRHFFTVQDFI